MVPVTFPLGEERIGTPKRTCVVIVILARKTERADEIITGGSVGNLKCCPAGLLKSWTSVP